MTNKTRQVVNALIGLAREHNETYPELDHPADDIWEWSDYPEKFRLRWGALIALDEGDELAACALAELAHAASLDEATCALNQIMASDD